MFHLFSLIILSFFLFRQQKKTILFGLVSKLTNWYCSDFIILSIEYVTCICIVLICIKYISTHSLNAISIYSLVKMCVQIKCFALISIISYKHLTKIHKIHCGTNRSMPNIILPKSQIKWNMKRNEWKIKLTIFCR